ncbi:FAD-dependent oxidoreductase [Halopseudomonas sp.]|uniref:NAD(P)/FAD-dependent oxidoreductase n=1 Tax=Halopseudomonas sp. TaxID=2901191 RepID=UPI0031201A35
MSLPTSVAIIGAGMAGISAARQLKEAGVAVELFDKSRGTGGRMSSKRTDHGEFDIGTQYFTARHGAFRAEVERWHASGWVDTWQPNLYRIDEQGMQPSTDEQHRYVGSPRMTALSRALLEDLPLHNSVRITALDKHEQGWLLTDADGNHYGPFDRVVVATPAPQAVPLLSAAPQLAKAAEQIGMEPGWAVSVSFATPLNTPVEAAFVRTGPLDWICANHSKPGRSAACTWVLQSTPQWAAAHLETPPAKVADLLLEALGETLHTALPATTLVHAHRWLYARPAEDSEWGALAAPDLGLYVCGDWCLAGRLEGAWLSGRHAAHAVLGQH